MGTLEVAILVTVFVAVVSITLWLSQRLQATVAVQRRLRGSGQGGLPKAARAAIVKKSNVTNPVLAWVQASTSISNVQDRNRLKQSLARAGFENPAAPVWYVIIRFGLAVGLPLLFLLAQSLSATPYTGMSLIGGAVVLCATGFIAPQAIMDRMAGNRRTKIEHEFPDSLDLMVVCVEAGLGLESSFVRVAQETQESHPYISREFTMVSEEMRAGRTRAEALRNLGERMDVSALKSFAALLIQTDALGTSIAQTLRTYSQEMREHRFLKAEEKAMRIPVLMTIPLVACILPVVVSALLLPPMIDMMRDFAPALRGG